MTEIEVNSTPQRGPQVLYQTGALSQGAILWVSPIGESSDWIKKLDWYLNFQITKAIQHKAKTFTEDFNLFLDRFNIRIKPYEQQKNHPLMISCEGFLPCKMLVLIPNSQTHQEWCEHIFKLWTQLQKPSLRIFLPNDFPLNDFSAIWPDRNSSADITIVPSTKTN